MPSEQLILRPMSMLPTLSECNLLSGLARTGPGAGGHGAGRGGAMVSYLCVQWQ